MKRNVSVVCSAPNCCDIIIIIIIIKEMPGSVASGTPYIIAFHRDRIMPLSLSKVIFY